MTDLFVKHATLSKEPYGLSKSRLYERQYNHSFGRLAKRKRKRADFIKFAIKHLQVEPEKTFNVTVKVDNIVFTLPPSFIKIAEVVEESKPILSLTAGWDDGIGLSIDARIYYSSILFLIKYSRYIYDNHSIVIDAPDINPCVNGSIDLSWRTKNARMLINFRPVNDEILAFYYGDLYNDKMQIKGNVPVSQVQVHLASWMINLI